MRTPEEETDSFFQLINSGEFQRYEQTAKGIFVRFTDGAEYRLPTMVEYFLKIQAMTTFALESLLLHYKDIDARLTKLEKPNGREPNGSERRNSYS